MSVLRNRLILLSRPTNRGHVERLYRLQILAQVAKRVESFGSLPFFYAQGSRLAIAPTLARSPPNINELAFARDYIARRAPRSAQGSNRKATCAGTIINYYHQLADGPTM